MLYVIFHRIGLSIAKYLAQDGAKVMVSSRKQGNVDKAVETLRSEVGDMVEGVVCHVGKEEDRKNLVKKVCLCINRSNSSSLL